MYGELSDVFVLSKLDEPGRARPTFYVRCLTQAVRSPKTKMNVLAVTIRFWLPIQWCSGRDHITPISGIWTGVFIRDALQKTSERASYPLC